MVDRLQSEFNMAVSYLNRLNALWYIADDSSMGVDVYPWWHSLLALFRELSTSMKEKEINEFTEEIRSISNKVNNQINSNNRNGRNEISQELYMELHKFELKLRKIMQDSGLQNKLADDPRLAMKN